MRKTYDKETNINEMFDFLEKQIQNGLKPGIEDSYHYFDHTHKELYQSIRGYFSEALENPEVDAACYILSLPQVFNLVDIFELIHPLDWVRDEEGRLSEAFKKLQPHYQYIALAAAESSNIRFNTQPALALGLEYWSIEHLKIFWQFTAIRRKNQM